MFSSVIEKRNLTYSLLTLIVLVVGYGFVRIAFSATDSFPFTQEIVLIILGTIATIFITSLLLNRQTAVEIEKEQSIRLFELKSNTFHNLFDLLEDMMMADRVNDSDIVRLRFITHKLTVIASGPVLEEYNDFLKRIKTLCDDHSFLGDAYEFHQALASLSVRLREDMLGSDSVQDLGYGKLDINKMVMKNSEII
ncbi:hypothetical protein GCM10007891_03530 [Methylophaga thalassica]|uniref:Uncharacterized protein n=1 Tax=Methylophaga thalassica TaxID=40223 RepID=A0ABQ5TRA4_9GAMM|nr:hypothetical protein [Methylophaga thalassica]GLP98499.1 hypothetical protein GCM10007891_03530 [Methylophaga thalassica]